MKSKEHATQQAQVKASRQGRGFWSVKILSCAVATVLLASLSQTSFAQKPPASSVPVGQSQGQDQYSAPFEDVSNETSDTDPNNQNDWQKYKFKPLYVLGFRFDQVQIKEFVNKAARSGMPILKYRITLPGSPIDVTTLNARGPELFIGERQWFIQNDRSEKVISLLTDQVGVSDPQAVYQSLVARFGHENARTPTDYYWSFDGGIQAVLSVPSKTPGPDGKFPISFSIGNVLWKGK